MFGYFGLPQCQPHGFREDKTICMLINILDQHEFRHREWYDKLLLNGTEWSDSTKLIALEYYQFLLNHKKIFYNNIGNSK